MNIVEIGNMESRDNYCDLTDDEIFKLGNEQWEALPIKTRTSAKSIELCEDLFCLREMARYIKKNVK